MTDLMTRLYVNSQLKLEGFVKDNRGVTAIEYALIGVAMATLLAAIFGDRSTGFLGALNTAFENITSAITGVTTTTGG
jgi:pilus assembly protein Flp/PilA